MPRIVFTTHLQKHLDCPTQEVSGNTLADALGQAFMDNPRLRGYLLDDQGCLRQHVVIFIDSVAIRDRARQSDPLRPDSEIYVMQALSGG